ncbi:potassium-transporting ATPase subunit B, partial [Burkholderia multivorans]
MRTDTKASKLTSSPTPSRLVEDTPTTPSGTGHRPEPTDRPTSTGHSITVTALTQAVLLGLKKFDPRVAWRNPVMFLVEIGAVVTLVLAITGPTP